MSTRNIPEGFQPIRHDRLLQQHEHDSYQLKGKLPEPTLCPQCTAVFSDGRWRWDGSAVGAGHALCPACRRINDNYPAGFVHLEGAYFATHREEIMHLVAHVAERQRKEHPLERIMAVEEQAEGVLVTTTDVHLARGIAEAVHGACQGHLKYHYNAMQQFLRVTWVR